MSKQEHFRPFSHSQPDSALGRLKFQARLLADFQVRTVHGHVVQSLAGMSGRLLDVGCGDSPYRNLVEAAGLEYVGCDIEDAGKFGYERPGVVPFDGQHLPFPDQSFDFVLSTEVLEHVREPDVLVGEMFRIMKPGAKGLITVPWSARYHYIPWDFHRFTPSALQSLFKRFSVAEIVPRGTDLTSIASKVVVACLRAAPQSGGNRSLTGWLKDVAAALPMAPLAVPAVMMGHASLLTGLGSTDDPLGYSVFLTR